MTVFVVVRLVTDLGAASPDLAVFRVAMGDDRDLDTVLGAELPREPIAPPLDERDACAPEHRDEGACFFDVRRRILSKPAPGDGLVIPSPGASLADVPEGHHAQGFVEMLFEPLRQLFELGEVVADEAFLRVGDVGKRTESDAVKDFRGVLEPHVADRLAWGGGRRHAPSEVAGKAEAARHATFTMTRGRGRSPSKGEARAVPAPQ